MCLCSSKEREEEKQIVSRIELRDYQLKAVKQMKNGCILCGGVGSGKSRTALAYYYIRNGGDLENREKIGMVCPKDLYIITTAKKRDDCEWEGEMVPFLLTTHDELAVFSHKVVVDSWNNIKKYADVKGAFFIFDEDKVTGKGAWVKAFLKIAKENEWIILSATPGDKYEDYIPVFIANGFFRTRTEFAEKHLLIKYNQHGKYPEIKGYFGTGRLNRLRNAILIDMDFKRPTESHHEDIWCDYNIAEYKDISRNRWNKEKDKPIENASEYCYCLRRLVNTDQSREVKLLELMEKHPRVIIFYNLDCELERLRALCEANGIAYAEWNGHFHQPIPFEESRWVYLVQYNSGAEGWNSVLTDTIIFWSQTYSYKTLVQAAGRIDRLNTPFRDLYYYHFKSKSGIDLAISKSLKQKKKFNESRFVTI